MTDVIIRNMTIDKNSVGYLIGNRKCSECLHAQNITGLRNDCSNCGAKMDEEKDD